MDNAIDSLPREKKSALLMALKRLELDYSLNGLSEVVAEEYVEGNEYWDMGGTVSVVPVGQGAFIACLMDVTVGVKFMDGDDEHGFSDLIRINLRMSYKHHYSGSNGRDRTFLVDYDERGFRGIVDERASHEISNRLKAH